MIYDDATSKQDTDDIRDAMLPVEDGANPFESGRNEPPRPNKTLPLPSEFVFLCNHDWLMTSVISTTSVVVMECRMRNLA